MVAGVQTFVVAPSQLPQAPTNTATLGAGGMSNVSLDASREEQKTRTNVLWAGYFTGRRRNLEPEDWWQQEACVRPKTVPHSPADTKRQPEMGRFASLW